MTEVTEAKEGGLSVKTKEISGIRIDLAYIHTHTTCDVRHVTTKKSVYTHATF